MKQQKIKIWVFFLFSIIYPTIPSSLRGEPSLSLVLIPNLHLEKDILWSSNFQNYKFQVQHCELFLTSLCSSRELIPLLTSGLTVSLWHFPWSASLLSQGFCQANLSHSAHFHCLIHWPLAAFQKDIASPLPITHPGCTACKIWVWRISPKSKLPAIFLAMPLKENWSPVL